MKTAINRIAAQMLMSAWYDGEGINNPDASAWSSIWEMEYGPNPQPFLLDGLELTYSRKEEVFYLQD